MLRLSLASCLSLAAAQSLSKYTWSMDGGSPYRLNNAVVNVPLGSAGAHVVFTQLNGEEDTESMVEELLLPSPLVTDFGSIVFAADNCSLMMYPDPAISSAYTPDSWRQSATWDVPDAMRGINEESQFAGFAIYNDVIYVLDGRNSALHAVRAGNKGFLSLSYLYTLYLNNSQYGRAKFNDGDTGIIPDPDNNKLWVVTPVATFGPDTSPGLAVQIDMTTQQMTWLPLPDRLVSDGCKKNYDEGSVSIGGVSGSSSIALLAGEACGLVAIDSTGAMLYDTVDVDSKYMFNLGEHSHPLYDPDTNNLYWLDFQANFGSPQQLCCTTYSDQGFTDCWRTSVSNIPYTCVDLPAFEVVTEEAVTIDYRWLWLALGLQPASKDGSVAAQIFISASATMNDETFLYNGLEDLTSGLFQYDTASGSLKSNYLMKRDMFNSAPLIVTSSVDNIVQVYVSSSLGYIYCFAANSVLNGPIWSSLDLAPIPSEDLPATTYTFLAVTQPGTILATSTAGGSSWQTQKATFAIKNGLVNPVVPSNANAAAAAQQASIAAGVSITVLILAAVGFWRAYSVVPAVKDATDSFVDTVKNSVGGRGQVKGVERTSLRAGGSGYSAVSSASAGAGSSYGSYGSSSVAGATAL